jgi:cell wall-associated NlpC family hydrolase
MRRAALLWCTAAAVAAAAAGTAGAKSGGSASWAAPEIRTVVAAGLMAPSSEAFRAEEPLTWGELGTVLALLGAPDVLVPDPYRLVTLRELDAQLVDLAGLRPSASHVRLAAAEAGLTPRSWLGTETVARMLGLRTNHPRAEEELELQLSQPATRAEAAYSVARLLTIADGEVEAVRDAVDAFALSELSEWQRAVLARALRFVGSPYVWAGTSEKAQRLFGEVLPGGFDCSGFVWRVFKLEPFAGAPGLASVLRGRTTYAMSREVPRSDRIGRDELLPGDVAFFGPRGPRSKPAEVGHMGIYVGNGWFVHSSRRGVALEPLTGAWEASFAWGRSPLAEAGLS